MRRAYLRLANALDATISVVTSALLALAACLGLLQVLSRFVFRFPFEWTEVLIRISLSWMVFLGIAVAFRVGAMISVDMMRRMLPPRYRRLHEAVLLALTLSFLALLGYMGANYAQRASVQTIIGLEFMSMFWAYLAIPVGCACAAIAVIAQYVEPPARGHDEQLENTL